MDKPRISRVALILFDEWIIRWRCKSAGAIGYGETIHSAYANWWNEEQVENGSP